MFYSEGQATFRFNCWLLKQPCGTLEIVIPEVFLGCVRFLDLCIEVLGCRFQNWKKRVHYRSDIKLSLLYLSFLIYLVMNLAQDSEF